MPPCRLKKKSPSERKVSDGLYFQNQKPEKRVRACGTHPTHESKNRRPTVGSVAQATHAFGGWNGLCRLRRLKKKSPSERKVSDGLYFQNQKPEKRVRACGTHPTHESKNRRPTVGSVAQATHAFDGWNGLCPHAV